MGMWTAVLLSNESTHDSCGIDVILDEHVLCQMDLTTRHELLRRIIDWFDGSGGSDQGLRTVWEYALRREMNPNLRSGPSLNGEMMMNSRVSFVMLAPRAVTMARNLLKVAAQCVWIEVLSP